VTRPRPWPAVAAAAALACLAGCGTSHRDLVVSAAASLKAPFERYGHQFQGSTTRFSFAGSDLLAAQIQRGVRPDVFASANLELPDTLHAQGLVDTPVAFASNRLVLAVPAGSAKVRALSDLSRPGVTVAIGAPGVPIGAYTRQVLGRLGARAAPILAHVRSQEPDVSGIVGKLVAGAVDAGFVYVTDVDAAHGGLRAIELPAALEPRVAYGVAVVRGAKHAAAARRFIAGLASGAGQRDLRAAGFGPPP
jgi:molybdate transport system substrate-binding protein